ncbi:MAG TPA: tetratricopeptide repeat protein [Gemmatimonadaceae bacterium]|nr:tetratricopeptide repeat protein [Gemmatimonadaceae bacterium]
MLNHRFLIAAVLGSLLSGSAAAQGARALIEQGDSLFRASQLDGALARYEAALRADSTASRAVFQIAVLRSWRNELPLAIRLHRRYIELEPRDLEGRVALARALSWAADYAASIAHYDTVLSREADYRDAALGRATTLAWWGRFAAADSAYVAWIGTHARDDDAKIERARVLSWAGRYDDALAIYAAAPASSAEAAKGTARVTTWKGDLLGGEALWAGVTAQHPRDVDAWVGLAQVRRWLGKPRAARDALDQALRITPGNSDAIEQRRWVDAELQPAAEFTATMANDSDDNETFAIGLSGGLAMPVGRRLTASVVHRTASLGAIDARSFSGALAWGLQSPSGRFALSLNAGVTSLMPDAPLDGDQIATGGAKVSAQLGSSVVARVGAQRSAFDEVVTTIASGVALDLADADVTVRLPGRFAASAAVSAGAVARGNAGDNDRWGSSGALTWSYARNVTVAARTRAFGYERVAGDGYFSPRRFQLSELAAHWHRAREIGWQGSVDAAIGSQRVRVGAGVAERTAWSSTVSAGVRWRPGVELIAAGTIANVASPGAQLSTSEYTYRSISLALRTLF